MEISQRKRRCTLQKSKHFLKLYIFQIAAKICFYETTSRKNSSLDEYVGSTENDACFGAFSYLPESTPGAYYKQALQNSKKGLLIKTWCDYS